MRRERNSITQPFREQCIFNNWDVVAKAWYLVCKSKEIRRGKAKSFELCGQRVVIFRGDDDQVRCMDAFCSHMGADLGIGKVVGNTIQCFFHHWRYDGQGECVEIPCGERKPSTAKMRSYGTDEKYGHIWIYPDANPLQGVVEYHGLEGKDLHWERGRSYERPCHHHINMINGIDAQHLRTVHDISMDMTVASVESEDGCVVDFTLEGRLPNKSLKEKIGSWVLGGTYAYSMRYGQGSVGLLSVMEKVRWFGRGGEVTPVRMVFAYTPLAYGRCRTVPIFVAEKKTGILSWFKAKTLLWVMKIGFFVLRDEDGAIYDNIRFQPNALLKMDQTVARFIGWVNKLKPSDWSTTGVKPKEQVGNDDSLIDLPSRTKEVG